MKFTTTAQVLRSEIVAFKEMYAAPRVLFICLKQAAFEVIPLTATRQNMDSHFQKSSNREFAKLMLKAWILSCDLCIVAT